jgi:hypothetical protein
MPQEIRQQNLRNRRRFVPRAEFAATSRRAPTVDLAAFRADQDAAFDGFSDDFAGFTELSTLVEVTRPTAAQ